MHSWTRNEPNWHRQVRKCSKLPDLNKWTYEDFNQVGIKFTWDCLNNDLSKKSSSQTFIYWLDCIDAFHIHISDSKLRLSIDCHLRKILFSNLMSFNSLYFRYPFKWIFLKIIFIDYFFSLFFRILIQLYNLFKISYWLENGRSRVPSDEWMIGLDLYSFTDLKFNEPLLEMPIVLK